ncbi:MAG: hypothetical protein FJ026_16050 [Chloroflexi bacterium]|nr:hypothetical protein [Chloroflexota bacterium]
MSYPDQTLTTHAMLVLWGQFAQAIGLIRKLGGVRMGQKTRVHSPQTKVIEFLIAILGGLPYLKDISHAAHPLDQDQAVARAWLQPGWADDSGVSRTLQALTPEEVAHILAVLEDVSQPFIDREVALALRDQGRLIYDGDLTGRPVSSSSTTYPHAAFGHMSDAVQLGYQAALVSMHSPTYGRLWLSVTQHPGSTVSCTQAEALALAAEARSGLRPWRRTTVLRERLAQQADLWQAAQDKLQRRRQAWQAAQTQLEQTRQQLAHWQDEVTRLEGAYQVQGRPERPHSRLAQARRRWAVQQRRLPRRQEAAIQALRHLEKQCQQVEVLQTEQALLQQRLARFEQNNATNPAPIQALFRLDGGFGTGENVALLIEMGYEVYTKPYSHRVSAALQSRVSAEQSWARVGANAEMVAWHDTRLGCMPYPVDVALERFHTGSEVRHNALLHYGRDSVTQDLTAWFQCYNGRQTIEAGIKEGQQVFQMHHLKVRSEAGLLLQEHFAAFAANFVRWAAQWLAEQCPRVDEPFDVRSIGVKRLVQVGANTSAWVIWQPGGCLVRFTEYSAFAGTTLRAQDTWAFQLPLPLYKSCHFAPF